METENDAEGNTSNDDTYVYLDFNGKLPNDIVQNEFFLKIANLHKSNPLVQVNDTLFKGTYDWSIGTNLFFKVTEENSHTGNAFEKQIPLNLKYLMSTTKLLNLQQVKIPQAKAVIQNETKHINYKLTLDYNDLLNKLENGTLRIEDISSGEELPQSMEVVDEKEDDNDIQTRTTTVEPEVNPDEDKNEEQELENIQATKILEAEYNQLNILASRPVKRAVSPELVMKCDEKYEKAFEYHNVERQILRPRDGFKSEPIHVNEETLSDCVDIDRCIFYGLIPASSDFTRELTKEEKEKLLTLENFDNLSLAARYYVLQNIVKGLQKYVENLTSSQEKDEYGRTPTETLEIYNKLSEALKNRLQQIKHSLETDKTTETEGNSIL